jgi:hypothetical protein
MCDVKNLNVGFNPIVLDVDGIHESGKTNDDVDFLNIDGQNCAVLPKGIENFFPNLKFISVLSSNLSFIDNLDIRPFPELESLALNDNFLKTLASDLFKNNPLITSVIFSGNEIAQVEVDLLEPLQSLCCVAICVFFRSMLSVYLCCLFSALYVCMSFSLFLPACVVCLFACLCCLSI